MTFSYPFNYLFQYPFSFFPILLLYPLFSYPLFRKLVQIFAP